jgi:hypothetical protein
VAYPVPFKIAALLTTLVGVALVARARGAQPAAESIKVDVAQGASLADYLRTVSAASGLLTVAERPSAEKTLGSSVSSASLPGALDRLCAAYHLECRWTDNRVVLIRRYVDPREEHGIEVEALQTVASDVHQLVKQVSRYPLDSSRITNKIDFISSLSARQSAEMSTESGLRYDELRADQSALWNKINVTKAFGDLEQKWSTADTILTNWSGCRLSRSPDPKGRGAVLLSFTFPDERSKEGSSRLTFRIRNRHRAPTLPSGPAADLPPSGSRGSASRPAPRVFHRSISGLGQLLTLKALVQELEHATGQEIELPPYARSRQVYLYPATAQASDVVMALEDLYGWKLSEVGAGKYRLGSEVPESPVDSNSFFPTAYAAIPPQLHSWWRQETNRNAFQRDSAQWVSILSHVEERLGADWQSVKVSDLDDPTQRRLAALILDRLVKQTSMPYLQRTDAPQWLATPERGAFKLVQDTGPRKSPLLEFSAVRPRGGVDRWGWYVGTDSMHAGR